MSAKRTNWAGNITFQAKHIYFPTSTQELQELVAQSQKVKGLGTRHAFNQIADCDQSLISTQNLNQIDRLDQQTQTVTVESGIRYGELCQFLYERGYALANLASLPHISVAGAISTGTHGSGMQNGNLGTAVSAVEFITADGSLVHLTREDEDFHGAIVSLGALGVITQITLDIEPSFEMAQVVYQHLPLEIAWRNFTEIMSAGYSVSLFTDWQDITEIWVKHRIDQPHPPKNDFYGAKEANRHLHPIAELSAKSCTFQMREPGPAFERLPHFKLDFTPSHGDELQSEYFLPIEHAAEALRVVANLEPLIARQLMVSEIRTVAADKLWLSPAYKQDCVAIHFTWHPNWPEVKKILPLIEKALQPFGVRPHWGKLFSIKSPDLKNQYKKILDFQSLVKEYDPNHKFQNDFLNRLFWR